MKKIEDSLRSNQVEQGGMYPFLSHQQRTLLYKYPPVQDMEQKKNMVKKDNVS